MKIATLLPVAMLFLSCSKEEMPVPSGNEIQDQISHPVRIKSIVEHDRVSWDKDSVCLYYDGLNRIKHVLVFHIPFTEKPEKKNAYRFSYNDDGYSVQREISYPKDQSTIETFTFNQDSTIKSINGIEFSNGIQTILNVEYNALDQVHWIANYGPRLNFNPCDNSSHGRFFNVDSIDYQTDELSLNYHYVGLLLTKFSAFSDVFRIVGTDYTKNYFIDLPSRYKFSSYFCKDNWFADTYRIGYNYVISEGLIQEVSCCHGYGQTSAVLRMYIYYE